jgi:hypothetical protein
MEHQPSLTLVAQVIDGLFEERGREASERVAVIVPLVAGVERQRLGAGLRVNLERNVGWRSLTGRKVSVEKLDEAFRVETFRVECARCCPRS